MKESHNKGVTNYIGLESCLDGASHDAYEVTNYYGLSGNNKKYQVITREIRNGEGQLISKQQEIVEPMPWDDVVVERIQDPGGLNLLTRYQYHTNASVQGSYGRLRSVEHPDGSWIVYEYDSEGRVARERRPWLDSTFDSPASQSRETVYDYTPFATGDVPLDFDTRPRTITETIQNIIVARKYQAFVEQSGQRLDIVERAHSSSVSYGHPDNMRTVTAYYPESAGALKAGRVQYYEGEDGIRTTYGFALDNGNFIETDTVGTASSPAGIAGKSERFVRTYDPYGSLVRREKFFYNGSGHTLLETIEHSYTPQLQRVLTEKTEGTERRQLWAAAYANGERVRVTDERGIVTDFIYDDLQRLEISIKQGVPASGDYPAQPDIITTYARDLA